MGMLIACNLLLPVLLIAIGALMKKRPPEKINALYGYRTERFMKNADTWRFANDYSGALIRKIGWSALVVSTIVSIALAHCKEEVMAIADLLLMTAQCAALIAAIPLTERALKAVFDDEGRRKQ